MQSTQTNSRFEFVVVASARARQLLQGCTPRVQKSNKPARTAQREVASGAVQQDTSEPIAPQQ